MFEKLLFVPFLIIFLLFIYIYPAHTFAEEIPRLNTQIEEKEDEFYHKLTGDWLFYPKQFISPDQTVNLLQKYPHKIVKVPSSFEADAGETNTFGTYIANVEIPEDYIGETLAIHIPYQYSAYSLFVNETKVASNGEIGRTSETHEAEMAPRTGYFIAESDEIILTMQLSSFDHIRGGFENEIFIGEASIVTKKNNTNIILNLFINGSIFITGLFMVLFSLFRRRGEQVFLIFGLFSMLISARALFTVPFYYTIIFTKISWLWGTRLEYIFTVATSMLFVMLLWKWHEKEFSKKVMYFLVVVHMATILVTLLTKPVFFQTFFFNVFILAIPTFFYTLYVITKSIRNKNRLAIINVIGMSLIFLAFFNDFAIGNDWYKSTPLMLPAVGIYVLIHILAMSKDFAWRANQTEQQYNELIVLNAANEELTSELQREIKQKDNFLANTSHELRNPLHGIINLAEAILRNEEHLSKQAEKDLRLQVTIGQHMRQTLGDLLDITRLKEQRIQLRPESLNIQNVVSGVVDMLRVLTSSKDIQIIINIPEDFPPVAADYNRLIQILFNLLHNAVKYTKTGTIMIQATRQDNQAIIQVTDTGIGIDAKTLKTIFNPYQQGDTSMTSFGSGIGLGLSIVRELVELHGGEVSATSTVGKGSTFSFTLDLADETILKRETDIVKPQLDEEWEHLIDKVQTLSPQLEITSELRHSTNKIHILAVDDDPINLKVLKNILIPDTYEITTVTSGEEALQKLTMQEWHLIISDVMMPNMSGYELTKKIRKNYSISELPILLLTARGNMEDISTGFLLGANDYVTKPVDATELNARVHALTHLQNAIKERLNMEAAWLQAQIRPHFVLNTLNAIISLSDIDLDRMQGLTEKFAQYLQRSFYFKNVDTLVRLQEELELLESYLYIEQVRFGDRLRVELEIDEQINQQAVMLPPLTLQTLVENAVNHGVLQKGDGGTITIRIRQVTEKTCFTIMDNGIGMDSSTIENLFVKKTDKSQGIGLINTEQRLQKLYGQGLTITSEVDIGTTVSFEVWPIDSGKN